MAQTPQSRRWGIITAYNPASVQLLAKENKERNRKLKSVIEAHNWPHLSAYGQGWNTHWPAGSSFLVFASLVSLYALQKAFGQYAIVCGEFGGKAFLIWNRNEFLNNTMTFLMQLPDRCKM
jgi:hypothetical protein